MEIEIRNNSGSIVTASANTVEQVWQAIEHQLGALADERGIEPYGLTINVNGGTRRDTTPEQAGPSVHIEALSGHSDGTISEFHHDIPQDLLSGRVNPAAEVWRQIRLTIVKLQKHPEFDVATLTVSVR